MRFTSFDGTTIAYTDEGAGPSVLLVHTFLTDAARTWGPFLSMEEGLADQPEVLRQIRDVYETHRLTWPPAEPPEHGREGIRALLLSRGFRVITFDMRGHGGSDKPADQAAYADLAIARDALALLTHLRVEHAHVVGYGMGGLTVAHLLHLGDERIRSAVFASVGDWVVSGEGAPFAGAGAEVWESAAAQAANPSAQVLLSDALGNDRKAMAAVVKWHMSQAPSRERLRRTTIPVLVLHSTSDVVGSRNSRFTELLPTAEVRGVDAGDQGSAPFFPSFQNALLDFLSVTP